MRTRYGLSPWIHAFPDARRPDYPRLKGEQTADVVVVGGGLTGCAIALALATSGHRPIVVEAGRIGEASSGRSAGLLLPEPRPSFRDVQQAHGLKAARTVFESWRRASLDAAALLRRASIKCAVEAADSLTVSVPTGERLLRREFESREAAGVDASWLTPKQVKAVARLDDGAGVKVSGAFSLDPYRACVGLAAAAAKRKARFYEKSAVQKVHPTAKHVEIVVDGGTITAATVVIATGFATAEFKPLRRHFKQRERYLVLTEPIPASVRKHLIADAVTLRDAQAPHHRLHWTADHRALVGGGDQDAQPAKRREAVLVQRTGQLMYELLKMYPEISGLLPEYGWEAQYGETADGLMYIGPHRNYPRHLFALGGDGTSITGAFLAARILTRSIQGQAQKGDDVFGWTR